MKIGKKIIYLLVIIYCFLTCSTISAASETVKIGYIDYENFISEEKDGVFNGYGVEYLEQISKYTKWNYEYVFDTWENILTKLAAGDIDFICQAQKTEERERDYLFSKYSIGQEASILYVKSSNTKYYYEDFEGFNNMRVAYLDKGFQKTSFIEYAARNKFNYIGVDCNSNTESFTLLEEDKVDAVAVGSLSLKTGYRAIAKYASDPFYFMSGKTQRQESLMQNVNDAIGQIKANDPLFEGELYEKYYSSEIMANDISFSKEEIDFIKQKKVINLALIPNRVPFSYQNEDEQPDGIVKEIMQLISDSSGLNFSFSMMENGVKSPDYLQANPTNFICGAQAENEQFKQGYVVSNVFYQDNIILASRNGTIYNSDAPDKSYTIGVAKTNMPLIQFLREDHPEFDIKLFDSNVECANAIVKKEVQFLAANTLVIQNIIQRPEYNDITILPYYLKTESMVVVGKASLDNEMITSIINKTMEAIDTRLINQIVLNQTVKNSYEYTFTDFFNQYKGIVIIIFVLIMLLTVLLIGIIFFRNRSYAKLDEANAKLEVAVKQANIANKAKSRFLAQVSHEIRTPMNAIIGLTNLAKSDVEKKEIIRDYLNKIESSSKLLLGIINDVLDMSAIEGGKMKIDTSEFDMKKLIEDISVMFYQQAKMKNIDFECHINNLINEVLIGDQLRINQILLNLLSNAFKFTSPKGKVTLNITQTKIHSNQVNMCFEVIDNGCGISSEMMSRLFKPFEQESPRTANVYGGSGLGLSIAKNLVDLMKGTIEVESKENVGSKFSVNIPQTITQTQNVLEDIDFTDLRVLIVDDDLESCKYCGDIFKRLGVRHDFVTNGNDALEKMAYNDEKKEPYNLCLISWQIRMNDGVDLVSKIRNIFGRQAVVVIVSSYDLNEIGKCTFESEADYFISKPLFQSTIYNILAKITNYSLYSDTVVAYDSYDFSNKRILVAEDVKLNMEVVVKLLERVNADVVCAYNGQEALDIYLEEYENIDLILMDINMPVLNGYKTAKAIRQSGKKNCRRIGIYAMTANAFSSDVAESLEAGMNGHIAKPIDVELMYKTIQNAFKEESHE